MFPGSQLAGLVQSVEGREARRLTPLYFFKLPLPSGFLEGGSRSVDSGDALGTRGVYRTDPMHRFLYLLYYPAAERPEQVFRLQFREETGGALR